MARTSFGGIIKEVSLEMLPDAQVHDYVLVHVGVAISKVNEAEALKVYQYLKDVGELMDLEGLKQWLEATPEIMTGYAGLFEAVENQGLTEKWRA